MNKQELIKHFEEMEYVSVHQMGKESFIDMIKQLDEPQKPVVPQFVADWYEECKDNLEYNLWSYIHNWETKEGCNFKNWLDLGRNNPIQTLINMHQFGYTVEKEKWYTVKMRATKQPLFYNNMYEKIFFSLGELATRFTRKELEEAGLDWVFDCPGVEVEEVEE